MLLIKVSSKIEKTIDNSNAKRDEGLSKELPDNLKCQLLTKQVYHNNVTIKPI